jgi:hypothetical protein
MSMRVHFYDRDDVRSALKLRGLRFLQCAGFEGVRHVQDARFAGESATAAKA